MFVNLQVLYLLNKIYFHRYTFFVLVQIPQNQFPVKIAKRTMMNITHLSMYRFENDFIEFIKHKQ